MKTLELAGSALSMGLLGIAAVATLTASSTAQIDPFPVNSPVATYGTGGAGTGGIVPILGTNSLPRIGNARFEIVANDVVGGAYGLLLYSFVGCDVPLPGFGRLYVQNGAIWPVPFVGDGAPGVAGVGTASIPVPLPNLPMLVERSIYLQGFFSDPEAAGSEGWSHTQGLMLTVTVRSAVFGKRVVSSQGLEFARIPEGVFTMGSPPTEPGRFADELQHEVTLTEPFYLQTTEVTQAQWEAVMGYNPSYDRSGSSANRPVESVSWQQAQSFIAALNAVEIDGSYRLPTEAEWEFACRAGSTAAFSFGNDSAVLGGHGWFVENSDLQTHDVASKWPNAFGLYDMHGNVWELCSDWYGAYSSVAVEDPQGPEAGPGRVIRGGSLDYLAKHCRSAVRRYQEPWDRSKVVGLRLVWERRVLPEMEFARIPAGTFIMGSPVTEAYHQPNEVQHEVTLTKSFWMQTTEVTQAQWQAVMGSNPSYYQGNHLPAGEDGANRPVETVSWDDIQAFLATLNALEPGANYRLPTEAEWEYACRVGSTTAYSFGESSTTLGSYAWVYENSGYPLISGFPNRRTRDVATKAPNAWGLYDMHGNVWEWCQDWHGPYPTTAVTDPQGPASGSTRAVRGGSWIDFPVGCRSAFRGVGVTPPYRVANIGFRLVRSVP